MSILPWLALVFVALVAPGLHLTRRKAGAERKVWVLGAGVEAPVVRVGPADRTMARFALRAKQVGYVVRIRNGGLKLTHPNAPRAKAVVRSSSPHTVFLWRRALDKHGQEVIGQSDKSTPCTYDEAGVLIGVWFRESGPR